MSVYGWGQFVRLGLAAALLACLATSGWIAMDRGPDLGMAALLATLGLGCALIPMFRSERYDACEPATLIALSVLIGTAIRTLFLLGSGSEEARAHLLLGQPVEILLGAAIFVTLGLLFYAMGYLAVSRISLTRPPAFLTTHWEWNETRLLTFLTVLLVVALVSMWAFYRQFAALVIIESLGDFSSKRFSTVGDAAHRTAYGYLRWGASLSGIAVLFLTVALARPSPRHVLLKLAMLVMAAGASVAFATFTSSRIELAVVFGGAGMAFLYVRGRVSVVTVGVLAAVLLGLFMAITSVRSKASSDRGGIVETLVIDRHFLDVAKTALIRERFHGPDDFLYGSSYLALLVAPVPRVWWPEKPAVPLGPLVGEKVYGSRLGYGGVPPGMHGELWMNFGWVLLAPGMFVMGVVLRSVYEVFRVTSPLPNGALLYIGAIVPLAWGLPNRSAAAALVDAATSLIPVLAGVWFISYSSPRVLFRLGRQPSAT